MVVEMRKQGEESMRATTMMRTKERSFAQLTHDHSCQMRSDTHQVQNAHLPQTSPHLAFRESALLHHAFFVLHSCCAEGDQIPRVPVHGRPWVGMGSSSTKR